MKTKFDVKSLLIGLLLGLCATLAIGAARGEAPQKLDADYRYQISAAANGNDEYTLFILDHEYSHVAIGQFRAIRRSDDRFEFGESGFHKCVTALVDRTSRKKVHRSVLR